MSLGNYDRDAFFLKLGEYLKTIPNLPLSRESYQQEEKKNEISKLLKKKGKEKEMEEDTIKINQVYHTNLFDTTERNKKQKKTYLNLFQVDRSRCAHCKIHKCEHYRACFNIQSFRGREIFQCLNCGCPMNSHLMIQPPRSFSNLVCKHVNRRYLVPSHLDFKALTAIFFVDRVKSEKFEIDVETFVSGLNEGSFNIFSFYEMEIRQLQKLFVEKHLYSLKLNLPKQQYEDYYQFMELFMDMFEDTTEEVYNMRQKLQDPADIEKLEFFVSILNKVNKKLIKPHSQDQIAFVFLITAQRQDPYNDFKKFLKGTKHQMPHELQFFYSSKNRYKGIRDGMLFFPQFFQLSVCTFVMVSRPDQNSDRRKQNDTLKDILDFNNFAIIKDNLSEYPQNVIREALSFIPESDGFLHYIQIDKINLKITQKIGPQSLTVLCPSAPNYYRISNTIENQLICDKLCPEMFQSQRVLVVYRPLIVRSGYEELLGGVWRTNDFTLVHRVYKKLSVEEASLLGTVEGIHPDNMNLYIQMMVDGFCLMALYCRAGAFNASKMLSVGCETGLRVRKSKMFTEVFVEHPMKGGLTFKEKIQMNFHNIFESYTEQNIFRSLRDLFDLEELVLQDNIDNQNKNVFMDDDDESVYLAQPPEVKQTQLVGDQRSQILRELNSENFNFFVFSTSDEISTEQLTSIFMSQCTQMQQIYVVAKPLQSTRITQEEYRSAILLLLKRMNFQVIESLAQPFDIKQANDLIKLLSPLKIPPQRLQNLVNIYADKEILLLSLVKPAGYFEMKSFLRGFHFEIKQEIDKPELIQDLTPLLIPCTHFEVFRFVSRKFHDNLDTFDGSLFEQAHKDSHDRKKTREKKNLMKILDYILMSTFGLSVNHEFTYDLLDWNFYEEIKAKHHAHIQVESKHHGFFEIRIRLFNQMSRYNLNYDSLIGEYQLISWYYSKVNQIYKQRCPISYQYRVLHEERAKQGEFDQIFDVQEFCGRIFLQEIYNQIFTFGNDAFQNIKSKLQGLQDDYVRGNSSFSKSQTQNTKREQQKQDNEMMRIAQLSEGRSKIIAYFWGIKLAKFTKELEQLSAKDFPNGYGPIMNTPKGFTCKSKVHDENVQLVDVERKRYQQILDNLKDFIRERQESDPRYDKELIELCGKAIKTEVQQRMAFSHMQRARQENQQTVVEKQFIKYFEIIFGKEGKANTSSSLINYQLKEENLRLMPYKVDLTNLRIIQDREFIKQSKSGAGGGMQFDFNYEQNEKNRVTHGHQIRQPLNNYVLVYTSPAIQHRFKLWASMLFILEVELKQQKQYERFLNEEIFKEENELIKTDRPEDKSSQQIVGTSSLSYFKWFSQKLKQDQAKIINSLVDGFKHSYFLEEEVLQQIQALYKETLNQKNPQPLPSILHMNLFLVCLEELDGYLISYNAIQQQTVAVGKQIVQKTRYHNQYGERNDHQDEFLKEINILESEMELLQKRKVKIEKFINGIFSYLMSDEFGDNFFYDYEGTQLKLNEIKQKEDRFNIDNYIDYVQNNLAGEKSTEQEERINEELTNYFQSKQERYFGKQFIPSKRYFLPLEQGNNNKEWGKMTMEQIEDKLKMDQDTQHEETLKHIDKIKGDVPFMKNLENDNIQQKWIEGMRENPGRFVDTRPDKRKTGIYVDTVKNVDKKLDEKIDKVIEKFMKDKMANFQQTGK